MTQRARILGAIFTVVIGFVIVLLSLNDLRNSMGHVSQNNVGQAQTLYVSSPPTAAVVIEVPTATPGTSTQPAQLDMPVVKSYQVVIP